ncbi:unnamed protein product [Laminaria digitata]
MNFPNGFFSRMRGVQDTTKTAALGRDLGRDLVKKMILPNRRIARRSNCLLLLFGETRLGKLSEDVWYLARRTGKIVVVECAWLDFSGGPARGVGLLCSIDRQLASEVRSTLLLFGSFFLFRLGLGVCEGVGYIPLGNASCA